MAMQQQQQHASQQPDFADLMEDEVGELSPEQMANYEETLATVNLDELVAEPFKVQYRAYVEEQVDDEDGGEPRLRRRPVTRTAYLDPMVPASLQMKAMKLAQSKHMSQVERLTQMSELVVEAWNRTEPGMTVDKLMDGLSLERISKIFQSFFKPATKQR